MDHYGGKQWVTKEENPPSLRTKLSVDYCIIYNSRRELYKPRRELYKPRREL